ncbi:MAG: xanthine dehydrogenase accessory factor [Paraglaciecola sp.]|jgi:xanthine dehydrogenase accessory factor
MINSAELELKAQELTRQGKHFALATVVRCESPTSAKPGAKALVTFEGEIFGWIGGGCAQPAVIKTVQSCIKSGQAQLIRVTPTAQTTLEDSIVKFNMACHSGGTLDIFIEPITVKPLLLIIGASPVAQALSKIASMSGFEVTVVAQGTFKALFSSEVTVLDSLEIPDGHFNRMPYVVVSTQGKRDEAGLKAALKIASPYTALVASSKKAKKLLEAAGKLNVSLEAIDNVRYPGGIDIRANTPEEIAVALLAELIQVKNSGLEDMYTPPGIEYDSAKTDDEVIPKPVESSGCCSSK